MNFQLNLLGQLNLGDAVANQTPAPETPAPAPEVKKAMVRAKFWRYTGVHPAGEDRLIESEFPLDLVKWVYWQDDVEIEFGRCEGFGRYVTVSGTWEQWKEWEREFKASAPEVKKARRPRPAAPVISDKEIARPKPEAVTKLDIYRAWIMSAAQTPGGYKLGVYYPIAKTENFVQFGTDGYCITIKIWAPDGRVVRLGPEGQFNESIFPNSPFRR